MSYPLSRRAGSPAFQKKDGVKEGDQVVSYVFRFKAMPFSTSWQLIEVPYIWVDYGVCDRDIHTVEIDDARHVLRGRTPENPILVLGSGEYHVAYIGEVLKAEGFNEFQIESISDPSITIRYLKKFDIVVLGETPLTASQAEILVQYVEGGEILSHCARINNSRPYWDCQTREGPWKTPTSRSIRPRKQARGFFRTLFSSMRKRTATTSTGPR